MSTTFRVDREVSFSANMQQEDAPYVYTRWANPTTDQLEGCWHLPGWMA
jgi:O-acetylhomoserine/O-acetylserine sulfhydrylase-like pyridoxal-dependent enzyme